MNTQFQELLQKRMDRKDFLKHVGIGVVALTGASAVLKAVMPVAEKQGSGVNGAGYGASVYGGQRPTVSPAQRN